MSFQAYIKTIKSKTGKNPEDFKLAMERAGKFTPNMKATDLINYLHSEFNLGRGHSMAIWAVFKDKGWVKSATKK